MAKKKSKKIPTYKIPEPKLDEAIALLSKYKVGAKGIPFYDIKKLKPVFAFDYLSFGKSDLCFDNDKIQKDDLLGFFRGLKKVSSFSYEEMDKSKALRFHSIDLNDNSVSINPRNLLEVLAPSNRGMTEDELPTLYQFDLQYQIEARAVGFLFKGIFYIIWYDRDHVIYPKKK